MKESTAYLLAFQKIGIGAATLRRLLETIPLWPDLWKASQSELAGTGASDRFISEFVRRRSTIDPHTYAESIVRPNTSIIDLDNPAYPTHLRTTHSPPLVLFVRGNLSALEPPSLTVVGTRDASSYGRSATQYLIGPVAPQGIVIVSGLAFGIDAAAHQAAITGQGKTIAVLGSGADLITPQMHRALGQSILEHAGAIISEYPPGTQPLKHHFPQRNRILAGLSKATLVVEAGQKSGALITAKFALEEGREVLAMPGPITDERSAGVNQLIRDGATPITSADDIRHVFGLDSSPRVVENIEIDARSESERTLLTLLVEPRHVDELVKLSKLDASVVNATLSLLELRGIIRHLGGSIYRRTHYG